MIISTPEDLPNFKKLLGDGADWGLQFTYAEQPKPEGLAQAFLIAEKWLGNDDVCLVLGDNIFYGNGFTPMLQRSIQNVTNDRKASIFGYYVNDPERYGVAGFDQDGKVTSIEEKPENPKSNYAVVGLYFYPNSVVDVAKNVKPSIRGELEISSVNEHFLKNNQLKVELMGRGYAWLDTGTQDSMLEASNYIHTIEKRQGLKIACLEEIAYDRGFIDRQKFEELAKALEKSEYGKYLLKRLKR